MQTATHTTMTRKLGNHDHGNQTTAAPGTSYTHKCAGDVFCVRLTYSCREHTCTTKYQTLAADPAQENVRVRRHSDENDVLHDTAHAIEEGFEYPSKGAKRGTPATAASSPHASMPCPLPPPRHPPNSLRTSSPPPSPACSIWRRRRHHHPRG